MRFSQKLILCFFFILTQFESNASHLVGGVIYYDYLGKVNGKYRYKLTFEVYRDCSSKVHFDGTGNLSDPTNQIPDFYFSVYKGNASNNIAYIGREINVNNALRLVKPIEKVRPIIVHPCLEPNETCVEKGVYEVEIDLPNGTDGYTVQYQRCCRNNSIANIYNEPGQNNKPGMTLSTYIPPVEKYFNNSARFKQFPPIFLCENQAFYFDHSATDIDGDKLRYFLTTPLTGLTGANNGASEEDQTKNTNPVDWAPPFSINNVCGGTPPMTIDSITGLLKCKPSAAGRYVVSIMVKEYRNNLAIDSFARDFQYNVLNCGLPNADAPFIEGTYDPYLKIGTYVECGDYKIDFINTSSNATRYEWNFGDPNSGTKNTSTQTNPSYTFSDTGTFIVVLRAFITKPSGELCFDTTRRICKIYPKPKPSISYTSVCEGNPIQLNYIPNPNNVVNTYNWEFENGATSNIPNPSHTYSGGGVYNTKLQVIDNKGCKSDTIIPVIVYNKPIINAIVPNGCIFQELKLTCQTKVASPYNIAGNKWSLPDGSFRNTCNTTYTPLTMAGSTVKLWAITDKGCQDSANFNFSVFPLPVVTASSDQRICFDKTAALSVSGANTYLWMPGKYLNDSSSSNVISSPIYPDSIKYIVKGTDNNGCYNLDSVKVSFYPKSPIDAGLDTSVCLNSNPLLFKDKVQLTGVGSFASVYWTPTAGLDNPNSISAIANPTQNTTYTLHGIDGYGCIVTDTVRVTVLDPALDLISQNSILKCQFDTVQINAIDQGKVTNYLWSPPSWISKTNVREPLVWPPDTFVYTLSVSNYCYSKTDNVTINSVQLPDPQVKHLDSICVGSVYPFSSNPYLSAYLWTTNEASFSNRTIWNPTARPSQSKYYKLLVTDQYGCKNTDSIELNVNYPPGINILGYDNYICQGDTAKLSIVTNIPSTYKWWSPPAFTSDTVRTDFYNVSPFDTTKYYVMATSLQKCVSIMPFTINVQKPIRPYAKSPLEICKGKFVDLYASGGLYYLWTPKDSTINDTLTQTPQVYPPAFKTYTCYISNDCFIDSAKVDIYVDSIPTVTLGPDTSIYRGQSIVLNAKYNAEQIEWYPKTELTSNPFTNSIEISPMDTVKYWAEVTNSRGCVGADTIYVNVYGKNVLLIPNGFSPNGDGINDVFHIAKYLNIKTLNSLEVYNRWGEKVYQTNNLKEGWNGKFEDALCPAGVYIWKVEATTYDNEKLNQSGNITLLR